MKYTRLALFALCVLLGTALHAPAQEKQPVKPPEVPPGAKAVRDVEYVPGGHERHKLDLYLPEKTGGPLPVIVWIHGGGWRGGSKERCPALPLVTQGFAVVSINYRLSDHAKFPAQIEDCKAAIRWLRANAKKYNLDPNSVGVWGGSAGGHLVALLGTAGDAKEWDKKGDNLDQSSRVQCVVDWYGPSDFGYMAGRSDKADSAVALLLGGPVSENKDKAARASPVTYASKDDPPFLIMHGDKDPIVPLSQSERLAEVLKKAGVEVTLKTIEGARHGGKEFASPESMKLIGDFFDKHLKKKAGK